MEKLAFKPTTLNQIKQRNMWTETKYLRPIAEVKEVKDEAGTIIVKAVKGKKGTYKWPVVKITQPDKCYSYDKAMTRMNNNRDSKHVGIILSSKDNLIAIDFDVDPTGQKENSTACIPGKVTTFVGEMHPTHTHHSPSGHGVHAVYELSDEDAQVLRDAKFKWTSQTGDSAPFIGEIFWSAFITMTETPVDVIPYTENINRISLEDLYVLCPALKVKILGRQSGRTAAAPVYNMDGSAHAARSANIDAVLDCLKIIPPTVDTYMARAYANEKNVDRSVPNNYYHWLNVFLMVSHAAASGPDHDIPIYAEACDKWSAQDAAAYGGYEATVDKFMSCLDSTRENILNGVDVLTYHSLILLAKRLRPDYPDVFGDTMIPGSVDNINTLLTFHDIHLIPDSYATAEYYLLYHKDTAKYFKYDDMPDTMSDDNSQFTYDYNGVEYIAEKVDLDGLRLSLAKLTQESGYPKKFNASLENKCVQTLIKRMPSQKEEFWSLDILSQWMDHKLYNGGNELYELIDTLKLKKTKHALTHGRVKAILVKIFMHMWVVHQQELKREYDLLTDQPCIPMIKGAQATRKTTWTVALLAKSPLGLQACNIVRDKDFNNPTELVRTYQNSAQVVFDDGQELIVQRNILNSFTSAGHDSNRAMHKDNNKSKPRRCTAWLTMNNFKLITSDEGNRRLFLVEVDWCDTDAANALDMQRVYIQAGHLAMQEIKKGNRAPWALTEAEIEAIEKRVAKVSKTNSTDTALIDLYGPLEMHENYDMSDYGSYETGFAGRPRLVKEKRLLTGLAIFKALALAAPSGILDKKVTRNNIESALERYCGTITNTLHKPAVFGGTVIQKGYIMDGGSKYYLVPTEYASPFDEVLAAQEGE